MISRRVFLQAGVAFLPWLKLQPLTMQLDWRLNAQFAGLCVAKTRGTYRRQGLEVTLNPASVGTDVIKTVMSQPQTLGCAEESLILAAQAKGAEVVAIATMLQASPLSLMSLPQRGLSKLQQLVGKRIGVHSDGRKALELVLNKNHISSNQLDIVTIPYRDKHQRLINSEFDAVQCYALDEPFDVARRLGQLPMLLTFHDYGFDAYSQVIFAPAQLLVEQSQIIHRFLNSTFTGWRWALEHPTQTAQILVEQYVEPDYQDVDYQTRSLQLIANYVQPEGQKIGCLDPVRWQRSAEQLAQAGLIDALPPSGSSIDLSLWS
ncbi:MAG: ABC transporter substrate-binding protein [Leptolyngbyaceae cyanobacterium]